MIYYPLGFSIALLETVPEKELTFTACKGSRSVLCILQMGNRGTKILRLKLLFSTLLNWTLTFSFRVLWSTSSTPVWSTELQEIHIEMKELQP